MITLEVKYMPGGVIHTLDITPLVQNAIKDAKDAMPGDELIVSVSVLNRTRLTVVVIRKDNKNIQ